MQNYTEDNFREERFGLRTTLRMLNLGDVQVRYARSRHFSSAPGPVKMLGNLLIGDTFCYFVCGTILPHLFGGLGRGQPCRMPKRSKGLIGCHERKTAVFGWPGIILGTTVSRASGKVAITPAATNETGDIY